MAKLLKKMEIMGIEVEIPQGTEDDERGATFTPKLSGDGYLTWTNDKNLANPEPTKVIPTRGTDYWTPEDKAAIVQDVLASMTNAEEMKF